MAIIQRAQDPEDGDETCDCVKCRIKAGLTAKAQALARRDPVGLLLELKNSPSTFKPCLCAFAGALYEQLLDDAWLKRAEMSGPERDRLRQLLDAGLVPHLHALILSEFISHHQLLGVVAVALANLALLVRNKAWWHRRPVVGQLRALVKPLIALIEAKPLTFFDPKHDDDRVEMIVAALGYLHEPPYAMSSSTPTDGLIRVLISAVMRVPDGPGKALDVLQGIARVNEARCWQALPAQASSWSSIGREEVVGYIARTVKSLAAAAAADDAQSSEVDASDVIRVVSLWAYVVPPDDAIAATLLIDNDCGTALTDLLNALVVAHARVGADAGEACAAFGPVLGVFAQIWTRTPASSTIDDDLEALAIGLLPSLELIFAIAQHSCSCNPERRRSASSIQRSPLTLAQTASTAPSSASTPSPSWQSAARASCRLCAVAWTCCWRRSFTSTASAASTSTTVTISSVLFDRSAPSSACTAAAAAPISTARSATGPTRMTGRLCKSAAAASRSSRACARCAEQR